MNIQPSFGNKKGDTLAAIFVSKKKLLSCFASHHPPALCEKMSSGANSMLVDALKVPSSDDKGHPGEDSGQEQKPADSPVELKANSLVPLE